MPQVGLIIRVLIASPSDVEQERRIIRDVIHTWNAVHSLDSAVIAEPVMWETHSRPAMGDRPQGIINRQLVDHCDLLVGAFWTRLGTPTGEAESGTAEEIDRFRAEDKPVLLYFSSVPVVPESLDMDQYKALIEYRNQLEKSGLYSKYESTAEFRELLERHFAGTMIDLIREYQTDVPGSTSVPQLDPDRERRSALQAFQDEFASFLRRLKVEWSSERDSGPHSIDDGKYILGRATDNLLHFRSMIDRDGTGLSDMLDEALKRLRAIQRHSLFLDGGESFREFWSNGDEILNFLGECQAKLARIVEELNATGA